MLRLRNYARISVENRRFCSNGASDPKFQVEGITSTNHSSSQKTRLNDLSYDVKIWTDLSSILSQSTRLTDRRTEGQRDRQAEFSSPIFNFLVWYPLRSILMRNLRLVSSAVPEILWGSQNLKVGHVTQATLPCDLILSF